MCAHTHNHTHAPLRHTHTRAHVDARTRAPTPTPRRILYNGEEVSTSWALGLAINSLSRLALIGRAKGVSVSAAAGYGRGFSIGQGLTAEAVGPLTYEALEKTNAAAAALAAARMGGGAPAAKPAAAAAAKAAAAAPKAVAAGRRLLVLGA
jgi:hypothetical protein